MAFTFKTGPLSFLMYSGRKEGKCFDVLDFGILPIIFI